MNQEEFSTTLADHAERHSRSTTPAGSLSHSPRDHLTFGQLSRKSFDLGKQPLMQIVYRG